MAKRQPAKKSATKKPAAKSKVGAPKGNKNAEKWTEAVVIDKVSDMEALCKNGQYRTLGKLCIDSNVNPHTWSEWGHKFKGNAIVSTALKRVERICEANLVDQAVSGNANATMAIFTLKNKHGWEDKRKNENTGANGGPMKIEGYTLITPNDDD